MVYISSWELDEINHKKKYLEDEKETGLTIKTFYYKKTFDIMHLMVYIIDNHLTVYLARLVKFDNPA